MAKVHIVTGSKSDLSTVEAARQVLAELGISAVITVCSAHRNPRQLVKLIEKTEKETDVYIGAAGMAAALPGVIAAHTVKPVIGIPIKSTDLSGIDALFSIAQMPPGVPVACVAINGSKNAGILAAQIIALKDRKVAAKLKKFKSALSKK
jgi:5-(carboxyamino)imidazole ribonucleotide mutase